MTQIRSSSVMIVGVYKQSSLYYTDTHPAEPNIDRLWNLLPKSTTLQTTLVSFKSSLQKFLDATPDKPPVSGYVTANNNSLLSWRVQEGGLQSARWPR